MVFMLIVEILSGIIIAILVYNVIHHYLVRVPNHKKQLKVKNRADQIVPQVMKTLENDRLIYRCPNYVIKSKPLSKVWGRDIFAYEFVIKLDLSSNKKLIQFRNRFNDALISYCKSHHVTTKSGLSLYLVADAWKYRHFTHLDIACIYNSATIDYLKDIHRL